MNCSNAQQVIARIKTAASVLDSDPVWGGLADHFETCVECERLWLGWDAFDDRIANTMLDVEVPSNAVTRLLERLSIAEISRQDGEARAARQVEPRPDSVSENPTGGSRSIVRWSIGLMVAASMLLALSVWMPGSPPPSESWTVNDVQGGLPLSDDSWDQMAVFDAGFEFQLPQVGWARLPLSQEVKGWSFDSDEGHEVAVVRFEIEGVSGAEPVVGVLAAIPAAELKQSPDERFFDPSTVGYTARHGSHYATVSWTEGETVYVCFVPKSGRALERLEEVLQRGTV